MDREWFVSADETPRARFLIALLIELETKQFSLAFSKIRGMRVRSFAEDMNNSRFYDDLGDLIAASLDLF